MTVAASVALGVAVVHEAGHGGGDGFKASVGVLRKARDVVAVVHSVGLLCVEVCPVALSRGLHLAVASRILVFVVDAHEEGAARLERRADAQTSDILYNTHIFFYDANLRKIS